MAISKVKLPDNSTQELHDYRIGGVDSSPTSGSTNLVTSGGVYTALQSVDTSTCEKLVNKVTSITASSTDTEYPSAKAVYDLIGDIESVLNVIIMGAQS